MLSLDLFLAHCSPWTLPCLGFEPFVNSSRLTERMGLNSPAISIGHTTRSLMMKRLLLPSLTTLAVLMMMPVSASAGPALPMSDVLTELVGTKTTLIQAGMRSKRQRFRRSGEGAPSTASGPSSQLSTETSQPTSVYNPAAAAALRLYIYCNSFGPDDLIPIGCHNTPVSR